MAEDKELTASELVGEIRKGARLYEAFKKADEIATFLASQEAKARSLDNEIKSLTKLREDAVADINKLDAQIDAASAAVEAAKVAAAESEKAAEVRSNEILLKARQEADKLRDTEIAKAQAFETTILGLQAQEAKAKQSTAEAQAVLQSVLDELAAQKERFSKLF